MPAKDTSLKRGDMPLSSFDPRYHTLIMKGCVAYVQLKQESRKDALRLRNILTTFRARYKRAHLADVAKWEPLYGAIIGVSDDGYSTVIRPRALEAEHLMRDVTIHEVDPSAEDLLGTATVIEAPLLDSDPLAEFVPEPEAKNND